MIVWTSILRSAPASLSQLSRWSRSQSFMSLQRSSSIQTITDGAASGGRRRRMWQASPLRCLTTTTTTTTADPIDRSTSSRSRHRHCRARVVVVGSGRMGHIRASLVRANPRLELCGIVDISLSRAQSLADLNNTHPFLSLEEAWDRNVVSTTTTAHPNQAPLDGVIICSPTQSHEVVIKQAALHGLAVFVEKPVDATADKIAHLFHHAIHEAGIVLCCGFQRRFDPSYVAATEAVRKNQIGKPIAAHLFFADHPVPSKEFLLTGGNIFMDLSAHDVDYIVHTLQDDVVSVYATGTSSDNDLAAAGVHDNAIMVLNFRKGAVATLFMSRSATYGYDQRCEIFGDQGLVSVGNVSMHSTIVSNRSGVHQSVLQHSFPERFHHAFRLELDAFADTILLGTPWPVTSEQCIQVQRVADAACLSAQIGQVVHLDEPSIVTFVSSSKANLVDP